MRQFCIVFLLTVTLVLAEQEAQTAEEDGSTVDRNAVTDTTSTKNGFARTAVLGELPTNMMHVLTAAGALTVSVIGIAIILYLLLQPFGFRLCHLVGNCNDHTPYAYTPGYDSYSVAAGGTYNQPLSYSSTNFQRRSLEYVGPILKALSAAYDKYAVPLIKKKE